MQGADVELRGITKFFGGDAPVVDDLSLAVAPGELVSILGPSGCGKTTTLRMVAGFVDPDKGRVILKNTDVTKRPPHQRDVGMLFQNYALFPHLTVVDNVSFGLKMRRVSRRERRRHAEEALDLVRLLDYADRYPSQLSGGQQQRVALARAIVIHPYVLLLDEPLSNLDARLRHDLRIQIRELQQQLRITTIFVTHDQEEALTISDRVVVMNQGHIEQAGEPTEIYRSPRTLFVTEFIGAANILPGRVELRDADRHVFVVAPGLEPVVAPDPEVPPGAVAAISLRPEALRIFKPDDPRCVRFTNRFNGSVDAITFLGHASMLRIGLSPATSLKVMQQSRGEGDDAADYAPSLGEHVVVAWNPEWCNLIPG